jgi:serine protease Do
MPPAIVDKANSEGEIHMDIRSVSKRPKAAAVAMALALGAGGLCLAAAEHAWNNPPASLKLADPNEGPSRTGFAPVVKKVLPTVVNVSSTKVVKTPTEFQGQMPDDDFFRQFFGGNLRGTPQTPQAPREQRERGLGSGVIVSPNGYILTNNHVVDGATDVKVTLSDKREFKAHVVGTDPKVDIAVLKIDATDLPAIVIGDSSKIQIGDYALAVGNPFGVGKTVTMGIVSATGRSNLGIEAYEDFIQTDAPINPGNSGGALINDRGELIGINTAILSHGSEGNQGIGFAVPVNLARTVMDEILKNGKVTRAYLGIVPQDVTPAIAKAFGVKENSGALVGDVSPNSPAQKSGMQNGDIILELNGKPVEDANQLRMAVSMMTPGTEVHLKVLRSGSERDMAVTLGELPTEQADVQKDSTGSQSELSGISVQTLNANLAKQLGVPADTAGVVVTKVDPSSAAADSGLQRGDVIQEVNRKPIHNTSDFEAAMRNSKDQTLLLVNRQGSTMYVAV